MYKGSDAVSTVSRYYLIWIVVSDNQLAIMSVTNGIHQCPVPNRIPFRFRATGVFGRERVFVKQIVDRVAT
jgi:hypothetical protein